MDENTTKPVYATQGGGYAEIIGENAYFIRELDRQGCYHFNTGDMVPEQWDLAFVGDKTGREIRADLNKIDN